jgi:hypothetical protein
LKILYDYFNSPEGYNYNKQIFITEIIDRSPTAQDYLKRVNEYRNEDKKISLINKLKIGLLLHANWLLSQGFVKAFLAANGEEFSFKLTHKGRLYVESGEVVEPKKGIEKFIYHHTSRAEELHRSRAQSSIYYIMLKLGIMGWLLISVFLSAFILQDAFQGQYDTQLGLLFEWFSWLRPYIYASSFLYSLLIIFPIHFILSITISRKRRVSLKIIKIAYYSIVGASLVLGIATSIILYGS